jgi:hypothetical protein
MTGASVNEGRGNGSMVRTDAAEAALYSGDGDGGGPAAAGFDAATATALL